MHIANQMFCSQTGQIVLYLSENKQKMKTAFFFSHRIIQMRINMIYYVYLSGKSTSKLFSRMDLS